MAFTERTASALADQLEPLLEPEFYLTVVPWRDEDGEWIVTVWAKDEKHAWRSGDVMADIKYDEWAEVYKWGRYRLATDQPIERLASKIRGSIAQRQRRENA